MNVLVMNSGSSSIKYELFDMAQRRSLVSGLVERIKSPEDGRGVVCAMTDKGWDLLVAMAPTHVRGVRANLVDLVDPEDFAAVGRVFDAVADHLIAAHPEMEIRGS